MSGIEQAAARAAAQPERSGPLTWVQQEWLPAQPDARGASYEDNMFRELELAPLGFEPVRRAVRAVLARHEILRSRVVGLGSDACQVVDPVDPGYDRVLEPVALDGWEEAVSAARLTSFRLSLEWPLRLLAGTEAGKVSRIAMVVDHWAADGLGILALFDDLTGALDAEARGTEWTPAGPVEQPIDLARWESATPAGAEYLERAVAYWRRQYERLVRGLGDYRPAAPDEAARGDAPLLFPGCTMSSVRLAEAAATVADRLRVPVAAVYLAAFSAAIGAAERVGAVGTFMLAANRLTPAALRSVRNAVTPVPVVLAVSPPGGFDETVASAAAQQMQALRYANAEFRLTEGVAGEVLGDLRRTSVSSAMFNFMPESALRGDRLPAIVTEAPLDVVEPMPVRAAAADRMFMIIMQRDRVIMTMRWREDTTWQRFAEPMLRHLADLILYQAAPGSRPPEFGG
ncbi:condensation domain-containing protein [Streptomyces sp. NPDC092296]|uniref:condensation domain-containing protein n=1 Tax=Streptomyces sp. NPDC092296 TaxID=3366012 RepID=UPI0038094ECD